MYLEACPVCGNHSVNVITIIIPPSSFRSILLGSPHLQTLSLDLTLQGWTFSHTRQAPSILPPALTDRVEERGDGFGMSVWFREGRVAAGRPVTCLPWDISFPRQILPQRLLQARVRRGPGIQR